MLTAYKATGRLNARRPGQPVARGTPTLPHRASPADGCTAVVNGVLAEGAPRRLLASIARVWSGLVAVRGVAPSRDVGHPAKNPSCGVPSWGRSSLTAHARPDCQGECVRERRPG